MNIERARELLGSEAEGKADGEIQTLLDSLNNAASQFYGQIQAAWQRDPESVRWLVHSHETGENE